MARLRAWVAVVSMLLLPSAGWAQPADAPRAAPKAAAQDAKKSKKKAPPKAKPAAKPKVYRTGPAQLRDKDGNVIPTSPEAYNVDSALPPKPRK